MSGVGGVSFGQLFSTHAYSDQLSIATPKKEFFSYMEEARKNQDKFTSNPRPPVAEATDAQVRHWAEAYDPEHMSQGEYQSFLDELVAAGVLSASDKNYISGTQNGMTYAGTLADAIAGGGASYVSRSGRAPAETLAEAGGNARVWAAAWSNITAASQQNGFLNRRIAAFETLSSIFDRMANTQK